MTTQIMVDREHNAAFCPYCLKANTVRLLTSGWSLESKCGHAVTVAETDSMEIGVTFQRIEG